MSEGLYMVHVFGFEGDSLRFCDTIEDAREMASKRRLASIVFLPGAKRIEVEQHDA